MSDDGADAGVDGPERAPDPSAARGGPQGRIETSGPEEGVATPPPAPRPAQAPPRVRVTAPRAGSAAASARPTAHGHGAPTSDIAGVYVRSLIRSQLQLGIVFAAGFAVATALFVLSIAVVPQLDETFVLGVPLSWLLLGVGVYPLAITVGALYVRAASRNEARYRSLTEEE